MASFRKPTFNLTAEVYSQGDYPTNPPRLHLVPCQWRGIAKPTGTLEQQNLALSIFTEILFDAGTDIRGQFNAPAISEDTITISALGFAWPFTVFDIYNIGKGFTNEYRVAIVYKQGLWPVPVP